MVKSHSILSALFLVLLAACVTAPYTGRSQFMLVSESQEISMGEEAYRHELRSSVLSNNPEALRIVRKVGERIARAADKSDYRWEFRVIDDPEMVNAFAVPGGKVAVYTGIFPIARDETGLAVVLGHEVAHALLRHAGERMSQGQLAQGIGTVLGIGLGTAMGSNPQLANGILQAYGLGAGIGWILPFSRSQESEADHVGLILMAKAGYDPRVSLEVWERMERKERGSPPEYLSTHPGYETRSQQLKSWIPEALKSYQPVDQTAEILPSLQVLDSPKAKAERELIKRMQAIDKQAGNQRGAEAVVRALGYGLRVDPAVLAQEIQQLRVNFGHYAALRGISSIGKASLKRVFADYQSGIAWSDISEQHGARLTDLISWMGELRRTAGIIHGQLGNQPIAPRRIR